MEQQQKILTFWDHLEELRHVLFRIAVAVVFLMLVAFLFKDELFAIVLAPKNADFIIYRFFCRIADFMAMSFIMSGSVLCENDQYPIGGSIHYSYERVVFIRVFCWHLLMLFISCSVLFRRLYTRMKRNILSGL